MGNSKGGRERDRVRLNERDRTVQREMQKERHLKRETEIDTQKHGET